MMIESAVTKIYKKHQIFLLTLFSLVVNLAGKYLAERLRLPLWLDSFGTLLAAYVIGPFAGAMVGAATNIIYGFIEPNSFAYALTSIGIGAIAGVYARNGWMKNLFKTMSLSVLITAVCVVLSAIFNEIFYDGMTSNYWGDGIIEMLKYWGVRHGVCIVVGEFYVDFVDKVFTLGLFYFFIQLYRKVKKYLPKFLIMQRKEVQKESDSKSESKLNSNGGVHGFALILLAGLSLFIPSKLNAEPKKFSTYIRTIYNNTNGLPGGEANDIASTLDGILWIGTYAGLYRHNGKEFRLMNEYDSIKTVRCLYADEYGKLLVGTNDNGFSVIENEEVACVCTEKDGLPADSIRCITSTGNGVYYIGTTAELAVVEPYKTDEGWKTGIRAIIPEVYSAVRLASNGKGLVAAVASNGEIYLCQNEKLIKEIPLKGTKIITAAFDEEGNLFAACENNQLYIFKIEDDEAMKISVSEIVDCSPLSHINSLVFNEDLLFLCSDSGAAYIDYKNLGRRSGGTEQSVFNMMDTGVFNNSIDNMIEDYQGNLWFSSSRLGLLKMCDSAFDEIYLSAGFSEAVVNSVIKFNGKIYFGTDNGLSMIDEKTGAIDENELTEKMKNLRVRCLMIDRKKRLWVCTYTKGLYCMDMAGNISQYETSSGQQFRILLELSDGTIAAAGKKGITFLKDGQVTKRLTKDDGFENQVVLTLSERPDGTLIAGTDGGGLAIIKNQKIEKLIRRQDGLTSNVILRTINDYDGKEATGGLYLITSNSICYMYEDFSIRQLSNFPYSNNYDLVVRENGNIFVLGSAGIFVVNRDELLSGGKVDYILLDLKRGLIGSLTANSWNYIDENNNLYLSCDSGASVLNLDAFDKIDRTCRMQLKSVIVNGERYAVPKDRHFIIPGDSDSIEVIPEILNYSINNPYISLYLNGIDEHPNVMTQNELASVIYSNIPSGKYDFHISLLDSKGINVLDEVVYEIEKPYRIYDNWWFQLYAFLVMMMAIAWLTWFVTATIQNFRFEKQEQELVRIRDQIRMSNETILSIANAVEARDKRTGRHSFRVAVYSMLIAAELGCDEEEIENIRQIGLLHDIGKIGVPDSILNKPSKLTKKEFEIMKTHVDIGGEILKDFTTIKNVADGAKYHHERFDGSGYNCGLKGTEIPLTARIIGIADAFDAMTSNRVYRPAMSMDSVISELKNGRGTQFDPELVDILLDLVTSGRIDVSEIKKQSEEIED